MYKKQLQLIAHKQAAANSNESPRPGILARSPGSADGKGTPRPEPHNFCKPVFLVEFKMLIYIYIYIYLYYIV